MRGRGYTIQISGCFDLTDHYIFAKIWIRESREGEMHAQTNCEITLKLHNSWMRGWVVDAYACIFIDFWHPRRNSLQNASSAATAAVTFTVLCCPRVRTHTICYRFFPYLPAALFIVMIFLHNFIPFREKTRENPYLRFTPPPPSPSSINQSITRFRYLSAAFILSQNFTDWPHTVLRSVKGGSN